MSFNQVFASAASRGSIAAIALAAAASLVSATAARADSEIVLVVTKVTALDAADTWLAGPDDFYARVTIDGEVFTTPIKRQRNHAEPNWKITKVVRGRSHDVKLEIFDKDIGKGDDLPEPETPVTQVKAPTGNETSMSVQVVHARAAHVNHCSGRRRWPGSSMRRRPARKSPVSERRVGHDLARRALGDHAAAVLAGARAPCRRCGRPSRIVSSSCSTTTTVLPRSRRRSSVSMRRRLSRWCRPMLGSSRM